MKNLKIFLKRQNLQKFNYFNFSTITEPKRKVTLFKGDGIGPEISQSVMDIFEVIPIS